MSQKSISAAAVSRILATQFKRAPKKGWGRGFEVTGFTTEVDVRFVADKGDDRSAKLDEMVALINGHKGQKYFAKRFKTPHGSEIVQVVMRDETDPEQNEARKEAQMEQAAADSPHAVEIREVKGALIRQCFEWTPAASGFRAERYPEDQTLVRVEYADHAHTTYETSREIQGAGAVRLYTSILQKAGFPVQADPDNDWGLLVGPKSEEDSPEEIKEALDALRGAVEDADLSFMTRKAGDHSLFVYYLVPFKDKVRRLEVFWGEGEYRSIGRFGMGGMKFRSKRLADVVAYCLSELSD